MKRHAIRRIVAQVSIFLLLGTVAHVVPTVAEVTEMQRNGMWWINDYFTMDYVGQLDDKNMIDHWDWWAGIPCTWIEGQMPGTWRMSWLALSADSAIWGLVLWAIWALIIFVRHQAKMARFDRGLCPLCAYPIGASPVCTECGRALPGRDAGRSSRSS